MSKEFQSYGDGFKDGACASIKKTLKDIDSILQGVNLETEGELRDKLRDALTTSLKILSQKWYKRGFKRGHIECYKKYSESKAFPKTLRTKVLRKLLPNQHRQENIILRSKLKNKFK